jgi:tRNA(fMet)-specific endonuclease VapC
MLDTNICIYIRKQSPPHVLKKLQTCRIGDVCMSAITFAELMCGCRKSQAITTNLDKLQALRQLIPVLDFDATAAEAYGDIRTALEKQGLPIGSNDFLIAAHALSRDRVLVTNNTREFSRIKGLKIENWVEN